MSEQRCFDELFKYFLPKITPLPTVPLPTALKTALSSSHIFCINTPFSTKYTFGAFHLDRFSYGSCASFSSYGSEASVFGSLQTPSFLEDLNVISFIITSTQISRLKAP